MTKTKEGVIMEEGEMNAQIEVFCSLFTGIIRLS